MNEWNKQRLDQMIVDGIEENLALDYKRADSLLKTDGKKTELTKDVSAFANSTGGILIYGIAEFTDHDRRHLPERLDPIRRTEISKEWLEQVIQTIQPRIEGIIIHPVTIDERENTVCYVVEVPQSQTAHQARDHRYYKRHNFNALAMEDYEIRDVMNRRAHPRIQASIFINRITSRFPPTGVILVKLQNIGRVLAQHVMVELEVPVDMHGLVVIKQPVKMNETDDGTCYLLHLTQALIPLFPGSETTLQRDMSLGASEARHVDGTPFVSTRHVKISVFADEMPAIRAVLDIESVLSGWTLVQPAID